NAIHGFWTPAIPAGATPTINANIALKKALFELVFESPTPSMASGPQQSMPGRQPLLTGTSLLKTVRSDLFKKPLQYFTCSHYANTRVVSGYKGVS
ncbi:MAG: hypothetical protein Q7U30_08695, partial [Methylicorpusculum sp.]|nr:hypothetical protein [Methylicorpusculum sp.]